MADVYGFNEDKARILDRIASGGEGEVPPVGRPRPRYPLSAAAWAMSPSGGIPARSGMTLGSATVTLQSVVSGGLTATSVTVTAYNGSSSPVAGSMPIQVKQEYITGTWMVDFEDCGASGGTPPMEEEEPLPP